MNSHTPHARPHRALGARASIAGVISALAISGLVLLWGGGLAERFTVLGLPDPGPITQWMLPTSRVLMDLSAAATVGFLLAAVVLAPRSDAANERWLLGPHAYRWVRAAGGTALVWMVSAVLGVVYTVSEILGQPVSRFVTSAAAWGIAVDLEQVQVILWVVAASALVALGCRAVLTVRGTAMLFVLSLLGTLPPAFGGHSAGSGNHQLAVSAMVVHVVGVVLWTGGLLALLLAWRLDSSDLRRSVLRYSRLAGWCLVLVAVSGAANLVARLGLGDSLWTSNYGLLVITKILALALLGGLGYLHRRRTIPDLERQRPIAFLRLAAIELVVFAATIGLAVGLSRTPPPESGTETDSTTELLGFPMPGPPSVRSVLLDWLPEPIVLTAAAVAVGLYLAAVRRLRRQGSSWSMHRTGSWIAGWLLVVLLTSSGLARYGYVLFSAHLVQHLALAIAAPALLLLGYPVTLAMRSLTPSSDPRWPGLREWLRNTGRTRHAQSLLRPGMALTVQVTILGAVYFGGLYEFALSSHAAHLTMTILVPIVGYVFLWNTTGADAAPHQLRAAHRISLIAAYAAVPIVLGLTLQRTRTEIGKTWFEPLRRTWGGSILADQHLAGTIALWAGGGAVFLIGIVTFYTRRIHAGPRANTT